jgi:hypothetical protein
MCIYIPSIIYVCRNVTSCCCYLLLQVNMTNGWEIQVFFSFQDFDLFIRIKDPLYLQMENSWKLYDMIKIMQEQYENLKVNCYQWQFPYVRIAQWVQGRGSILNDLISRRVGFPQQKQQKDYTKFSTAPKPALGATQPSYSHCIILWW